MLISRMLDLKLSAQQVDSKTCFDWTESIKLTNQINKQTKKTLPFFALACHLHPATSLTWTDRFLCADGKEKKCEERKTVTSWSDRFEEIRDEKATKGTFEPLPSTSHSRILCLFVLFCSLETLALSTKPLWCYSVICVVLSCASHIIC